MHCGLFRGGVVPVVARPFRFGVALVGLGTAFASVNDDWGIQRLMEYASLLWKSI